MTKTRLNFIIDSAAVIIFAAVTATGFIMMYVLPPGTGGCGRHAHGGAGRGHIRELLGMSRHQWGEIHYWLAVALIILMAVHIYLHWEWVKSQFRK